MSDFDPADFVDDDFQARKTQSAASASGLPSRAPTREEVDSKVVDAQQKLTELKHAQEELERERAALEETRRRQMEFQTGRQEMVHNLTRGLGLLEEAEFSARRDAEQMAKTITEFRDTLTKIEAVREETWTKDNFNVELTRALTAVENGRMEWNSARLKFPLLTGEKAASTTPGTPTSPQPFATGDRSFSQLCSLGLALTWPLALVALIAVAGLIALLCIVLPLPHH
jgi:predicted nuclease with TOPRIM domain